MVFIMVTLFQKWWVAYILIYKYITLEEHIPCYGTLDHNSCTTLSVFQHLLFYIKQVGYMEAHFSSRHKGICTY